MKPWNPPIRVLATRRSMSYSPSIPARAPVARTATAGAITTPAATKRVDDGEQLSQAPGLRSGRAGALIVPPGPAARTGRPGSRRAVSPRR